MSTKVDPSDRFTWPRFNAVYRGWRSVRYITDCKSADEIPDTYFGGELVWYEELPCYYDNNDRTFERHVWSFAQAAAVGADINWCKQIIVGHMRLDDRGVARACEKYGYTANFIGGGWEVRDPRYKRDRTIVGRAKDCFDAWVHLFKQIDRLENGPLEQAS